MFVPTRVVVPDEDFASAFAELEAIEPVTSRPSVVLDPRREFLLSGQFGQGEQYVVLWVGSHMRVFLGCQVRRG